MNRPQQSCFLSSGDAWAIWARPRRGCRHLQSSPQEEGIETRPPPLALALFLLHCTYIRINSWKIHHQLVQYFSSRSQKWFGSTFVVFFSDPCTTMLSKLPKGRDGRRLLSRWILNTVLWNRKFSLSMQIFFFVLFSRYFRRCESGFSLNGMTF